MKSAQNRSIKQKKPDPERFDLLRQQAEEELKKSPREHLENRIGEAARLIHELQVHQVELELQNEELRNARDELEKLNNKLKDVYDFAPNGYVTLDEKGIIRDINLTGAQMLAANRKDIMNTPFHKFIEKDSQDTFYFHGKQVLGSDARKTCELRLIRKEGKTFDAELNSITFSEKGKGARQIRTAILDITKRKRIENALRKTEKRFSSIFQLNPAPIAISTVAEGRYLNVNDGWIRMTGHARGEAIGRTAVELSIWGKPSERKAFIKKLQKQGFVKEEPVRLRTKTGEMRDILLSAEMLEINGENAILNLHYDITERKKAEELILNLNSRLQEVNSELESYNYSVSHDLREPLGAVKGLVTYFISEFGQSLDEDANRLLDLIRRNTENMEQLVQDLLSLSRISLQEMNLSEINMTSIAKSSLEKVKAKTDTNNLKIVLDKLPSVHADPVLMERVFVNLLSNAVKFSKKKKSPVIEIRGRRQDEGEVVYSVKDNGAGFDEKNKDRLFRVFQRLHDETEYEGTGIGLAIVKRIVNRHGGRAWAEGAKNKGATFYFSIPS